MPVGVREIGKNHLPADRELRRKIFGDSPTSARLEKKGCRVKISSDRPMKILPTKTGRVFNFVPGFEAVPICVEGGSAEIKIEVA